MPPSPLATYYETPQPRNTSRKKSTKITNHFEWISRVPRHLPIRFCCNPPTLWCSLPLVADWVAHHSSRAALGFWCFSSRVILAVSLRDLERGIVELDAKGQRQWEKCALNVLQKILRCSLWFLGHIFNLWGILRQRGDGWPPHRNLWATFSGVAAPRATSF